MMNPSSSSESMYQRADILTEISAPKGLVPLNLHELWGYRELAFFMLWRDIKGRYRQMAFGSLWMIINPVLNVIVFTVLFGIMAKFPSDGVPFPLFNYSALLIWTFFASILFTAAGSLAGNRDLISKVYFPRLTIPLVGVLSALVDFLISFILLLGACAYFGYYPTWRLVFTPVFLLMAASVGLAVGFWFASWIVHFRDINAVLGYIIRAWMYVTPVVYSTAFIPEKWRWILEINPLTSVIEGFRWSVLGVGPSPSVGMAALHYLVVLLCLVGGAYYFRRTERSIVDIA